MGARPSATPGIHTRPVDAATYSALVGAVSSAFAQGRLQPFLREDAVDLDTLLSGCRGDFVGAASALVAGIARESMVRLRLEQGAHLRGASFDGLLGGLPKQTVGALADAIDPAMLRADTLGAAFETIINGLVHQHRLTAQLAAPLLRSCRTVAQRIGQEVSVLGQRLADTPPGVTVATRTASSEDCAQMTACLQGGLRYAATLSERGLDGPAAHIASTLHQLAPMAVPASGATGGYDKLSFGVRVTPSTAEGPLLETVQALRGLPTPTQRLATCLHQGELAPHLCAAASEEPWRFSFAFEHHNDNLSSIRDGVIRSDDGPTTSNGVELGWHRDAERWVINIDQALFTERGGMQRTDLMEFTVRHLQTDKSGRMFFDSTTAGWLFGVQGIGDYGGAIVQDGWHASTGWLIGGRRLGAGLQDTYSSPRNIALLLGAEVQGTKRIGLFDFGVGGHATVPIGPTGFGRAASDLSTRVGDPTGPYATLGAEGGVQWTTGSAMRFDGAPRTGFFLTPRIGVGWEFGSWGLGLEWQGNRFNTQPGLGDLHGESVGLTVRFGP